MLNIKRLALLFFLPASLFALGGVNEIPALSKARRELTSEFAILQRDLKAAKTTDQSNAVFYRLDKFCVKVNNLRGDTVSFGILAECRQYREGYGTTVAALCAKVNASYLELKNLSLPPTGSYDPQALNQIQRALDKMNELLMASERVRVCDR